MSTNASHFETSSNGPNMDTDEITLCAKSESELKIPRGLILLAGWVPNVACQHGKQHQALPPIPLDICQF